MVVVVAEMDDCFLLVDLLVLDSRVLLFQWRRAPRVQAVEAMRVGI